MAWIRLMGVGEYGQPEEVCVNLSVVTNIEFLTNGSWGPEARLHLMSGCTVQTVLPEDISLLTEYVDSQLVRHPGSVPAAARNASRGLFRK